MAEAHRRQKQQQTAPVRVDKKVGRNDPCPCGSGKKYKHCHGQSIGDAAGPDDNAAGAYSSKYYQHLHKK
ncbi:MAG: SEC-C domain-containing protein [Marinilabiliales bacterium]|nr:SEC-C domain-containing protein [Marinilabiliales bacterium]